MNGRPYNAEQLTTLTDQMVNGGMVINQPAALPPNESVVHQPGFERYTGPISEAVTAITGLAKVFTPEGRAELNARKIARLDHRVEVAEWLGERIDRPRSAPKPFDLAEQIGWVGGPQKSAAEKLGWVGVHKRESSAAGRPEAASNIGAQLIDQKRPSSKPSVVNLKRPTTLAEHNIERRLGKAADKERDLRRRSRWLTSSYGNGVDASASHHLSSSERHHMNSVRRKIRHLDRGADASARKFARIETSSDLRGKITRERLRVNRAIAYKQTNRAIRKGHVSRTAHLPAAKYLPPPPNLPAPPPVKYVV
ncbi:MAG: hypothetical protein ABIQ89_01600 [Candidatus Saccharimonadales bacterium]